jgi:tyrosinase
MAEGEKRASAATPLRPDIASAAGRKMVDLYAAAVAAMQDPAINYPPQPSSWMFQAYIHGVPSNPFDPANSGGLRTGTAELKKRVDEIYGNPASHTPQAAWKQAALACWASCTHASPYFTTWHRWYLYYFERICRAMCKDHTFMLPYWNYASDIGTSLQLPAKFVDQSSRLIFDDRGLGFANPQGTGPQNVAMNNGGYMPFPQIDYGPALGAKVMFPSDTNFFAPPSPDYLKLGFTGRVECVPHDMVHDNVGGWMGNVPSAAGDPIFFVHHCQIDRLYASWETESGISYNWGSSSSQPDETTWKSRTASFVDEKGKLVKVKLGDAISTEALGYGYDGLATPSPVAVVAAAAPSPTPTAPTPPLALAAMRSTAFSVGSGGASVTLTPEGPTASANAVGADKSSTTLVLEGIKLLRRPPAPLSVFLNLPKGAAPELGSPFYVGTLNLFNFDLGSGGLMVHPGETAHADHPAPAAEARFDVGEVLRRQRAAGLWDGGAVSVTVTTIGADRPGTATYVTFERATLLP